MYRLPGRGLPGPAPCQPILRSLLQRAAQPPPAPRRALPAEPNLMLAPVSSVMTRDLLTVPPNTRRCTRWPWPWRIGAYPRPLWSRTRCCRYRDGPRPAHARGARARRDNRPCARRHDGESRETIDAGDSLFATTLLMTQRSFHHLPVLEEGRLAGIVTTSDLILARRDDPVYLVQHISRQQSSVTASANSLTGMAEPDGALGQQRHAAQQVSQILTAISDAIAVRLIQLAEEALGPAPAPWAWLGFGSQARAEQLLGADQDNGIVIDDRVPTADLDWYRSWRRASATGSPPAVTSIVPGASWRQRTLASAAGSSWQDTVRAGRVRRPTTR
jgi:CBS domain-containing protein